MPRKKMYRDEFEPRLLLGVVSIALLVVLGLLVGNLAAQLKATPPPQGRITVTGPSRFVPGESVELRWETPRERPLVRIDLIWLGATTYRIDTVAARTTNDGEERIRIPSFIPSQFNRGYFRVTALTSGGVTTYLGGRSEAATIVRPTPSPRPTPFIPRATPPVPCFWWCR